MDNPIDYWYKKYLQEKEKNEKMSDVFNSFWHPMSESKKVDHPCLLLMHGYGSDVWICDAVEAMEKSTAQEWAYIDDLLKIFKL